MRARRAPDCNCRSADARRAEWQARCKAGERGRAARAQPQGTCKRRQPECWPRSTYERALRAGA
eukprot:14127991-Alexandrium_andersonii.AAC.1